MKYPLEYSKSLESFDIMTINVFALKNYLRMEFVVLP